MHTGEYPAWRNAPWRSLSTSDRIRRLVYGRGRFGGILLRAGLTMLFAMVTVVLIVHFLFHDPFALPTTSEAKARAELADLVVSLPERSVVISGLRSHSYDCARQEPAAATMTFRLPGDARAVRQQMQDLATSRGWRFHEPTNGTDAVMAYHPSLGYESGDLQFTFTPDGSSTDVAMVVWGRLGQTCGVD